ncbi:cathepsin [Leucania separata nucleopolyhedrovirus]|uniref:Viral cathepsin n=1 Tax=Leucania separata nucleopolyhedrovirus TaxID=1307956 RepID=Q0IL45_NPVLS|nr:cathepsin [Leucania separata nucleopolyhedrovirus]AAR28838.1 cathepsin [Leucania separata nucleopolyhedrovirus]
MKHHHLRSLLLVGLCLVHTAVAATFDPSRFNGIVDDRDEPVKPRYEPDRMRDYFERFVRDYNRTYIDSVEREQRYETFVQNLKNINRLNQKSQASYDINKFSDLTKDEVVARFTGLDPSLAAAAYTDNNGTQYQLCKVVVVDGTPGRVPDLWDWRNSQKVTSVKQQGVCGSCWAFASVANIESQYAIRHDRLLDLSEQQLVDCDQIDQGCSGGLMHLAFQEILQMGGLESELVYPYQGVDYACRLNPRKFDVKLSDCHRYDLRDERKLRELVYTVGPIAVAIDCIDIIDYKSGIVSMCNNNGLNHAVLLVGFGIEFDTPYWILKNSWGNDWGEKGYFRLKRNINGCGMMNELAASATVY